MKIYRECSLTGFEPWSGAKETFEALTYEQLEQLEPILENLFPDGASATELNDLLWFEEDTIAEWLGFENFESLKKFNDEEEG